MIYESRDANEDVGFEFAEMPDVAFRAHHLAAAGAEHHYPTRCPGIVRQPERQMGREGEGVQQAVFGSGRTHFNQPPARRGQMGQIALGKEKGSRFRASTGGEGHENRAKLGFKSLFDFFATLSQGAQNRARPARQLFLVGNHDKALELLRLFGGREQIQLRGKRHLLQILQRVNRVRLQAALAEQLAVMGREGQDNCAQIMPQLFGLQAANNGFRQPLPPAPEQVPVHRLRLFSIPAL